MASGWWHGNVGVQNGVAIEGKVLRLLMLW